MRVLMIAMSLFAAASFAAPLKTVTRADERWIEQTLKKMTLEEKAGQMLIPTFRGNYKAEDSEEWERVRSYVQDLHVGGMHTFGGDPSSVALQIQRMQALAKVPLMITADQEGGVGYVFPGATRLPLAMAIGATGDPENARRAGEISAIEGRAIGIHVNYYPVVDVQNNPRNPIINIRSFGESVDAVARMAQAYVKGAQGAGQIATAKHFPGHGDVAQDSHLELPVLDLERSRLDTVELPPFKAAIEAGVEAVMSAHIWLPKLEPTHGLPATLSHNVLTDLLRGDLGFRGVVFTDAMDMAGVRQQFSNEEATIRAVEAGADIVLFPVDPPASHRAIVDAVRSGRIPESRLDDSIRRLLRAKVKAGLRAPQDPLAVPRIVGSKANRDAAQAMMDAAVTLVRDEKNALPLRPAADLRVLHVNMLDRASGWREGPVGLVAAAELKKRFPRAVSIQIDDTTSADAMKMANQMVDLADAVVVTGFIRVAAYKGSIDLTDAQQAFLRQLSRREKPFVFTLFGSPYLLTHVPELPSYILTYDTHPAAELAAIRAIAGEIPFKGKLPISLPGFYEVGHGLTK
ncbi:MAG TPA: glycoside hydrolase family 3 N-terminal domain-containing protein [Thermoanaerobaculia bacterium]